MGVDGRIVDINRVVRVDMRCHTCGQRIDRYAPWRGHEACLEADESLYVNVAIENYEAR